MGSWRADVSSAEISSSFNEENNTDVMRTSTDLFDLASAMRCRRSPHHCLTKCLISSCRNSRATWAIETPNWFLLFLPRRKLLAGHAKAVLTKNSVQVLRTFQPASRERAEKSTNARRCEKSRSRVGSHVGGSSPRFQSLRETRRTHIEIARKSSDPNRLETLRTWRRQISNI